MANNFKIYSTYYDLLYKDKDYAVETTYINDLLKRFIPNAQDLLELGCGTGNHAEHLCKLGYRVTGIERSSEMVDLALKKNIEDFVPQVGDIISFNSTEKFDAAISLFHVISYLTNNENLIACFKSVEKSLKPGGIFIFDVWYSPTVYSQVPETRVKRLENEAIQVVRLAEPVMHPNSNVVDVNYEIIIKNKENSATDTITETHPMRHFSVPEIDLLAKLCGFDLLDAEEFLTRNSPGTNTWGVCFILKKNV